MRRVRYSVAATLEEFDTFVMGRKTWDVSAETEFVQMFGGGSMFRTLVDAGLVDTVEVAIMPVLLSQGVPLLTPGARITGMTLDKCETLPKSGIVMLSYAIPHA